MKRIVLLALLFAGCTDSPATRHSADTPTTSTTKTISAPTTHSAPAKAPLKEPEPEIR